MPQGHFVEMSPGLMAPGRPTRALPIKSGVTGIVRGTVLIEEDGEWRKAAADSTDRGTSSVPGKIAYWSLQDQDQPDVSMSGKIAGLPCDYPLEFQSDQFTGTPAVGDYLMVGAGVLVPHTDGLTAVARVITAPASRTVNDRLASTAYGGATRTGALVSVIEARAVFLPSLSIS